MINRDVLPTRDIDNEGVTLRSHQLLSRTLPKGASMLDLLAALDSPPEPPGSLCETQWDRIRYGDLRVEIESVMA